MILKTYRRIQAQRFQHSLDRIEREGNDDLFLIQAFGPQDYSNTELHALLRTVNRQGELYAKLRQRLFFMAAFLSLSTGGVFLAIVMQKPIFSYLMLGLVAITILLVAFGQLHLYRLYRSYQKAGAVAQLIQQELERRRKDASIF